MAPSVGRSDFDRLTRSGLALADPVRPDMTLIEEAARVIRDGHLVAFPTDTFFGLGADPFNLDAVETLFRAKGRETTTPVPLIIDDVAAAARVVDGPLPAGARALAEAFWPGPLTLVLPRSPRLPDAVTGGASTVGVRVPDHPVARAIARAAGGAVTGTSANRTGGPPLKTAADVERNLGTAVSLVVPGICGEHSEPSTVVDFSHEPPRVLRVGALRVADLRRVCEVQVHVDR